jgi:hypothetical protein
MSEATKRSAPLLRQADDFAISVLEGLSRPKKRLPCRFFYDATGSALFEEITRQPEYYPTRREVAILKANATQMLERESAETVLVEFGSGSSIKTETLIQQMRLRAYFYCVIRWRMGYFEDSRSIRRGLWIKMAWIQGVKVGSLRSLSRCRRSWDMRIVSRRFVPIAPA